MHQVRYMVMLLGALLTILTAGLACSSGDEG
jgi:hypothetical protein